jgi:small-conductance mechanosensitive channel
LVEAFARDYPSFMHSLTIFISSYREATYTAVLALILLCLASAAAWVMSRNQSRESQRFWQLTFRHIAALCFMLGLGVIWRAELHSMFIALGAATAGILLAFRENWLSLLAFWTRVIKHQYSLNDFVEVGGVRGKVIDITWLTTVVAESVPGREGTLFSGKVVHIPNHKMLQDTLTVDNLTDEYTLHIISLPMPKGARPVAAEKLLLEIATRHCAPYLEEARKHIDRLMDEKALDIASVEPRAYLSVGAEGAVTILVRITVPHSARGQLQQAILHEFFEKADGKAWPPVAAK